MKQIVEVGKLKIGVGIPKICVPIVATSKVEILKCAEAIKISQADFVEWRADFFDHIDDWQEVEALLRELKEILENMPLLFTIRTVKEGGNLKVSSEEYLSLNSKVIKSSLVDIIDIEFFVGENIVKSLIEEAKIYKINTIISNHDFEKTPEKAEIIKRMCHMQKLQGDIIKIAVMPKDKRDVLALLDATEEMARIHADRPIITMSMSPLGVVTRVSGEIFGSAVTFGTVGEKSAPGQLPVEKLKNLLEVFHHGGYCSKN